MRLWRKKFNLNFLQEIIKKIGLGFINTWKDGKVGETSGNFGLIDMALAIRVIKDNARFFGGDPDRITISGESAGGWAVGMQVFIF